jgi:hypothetical protein
MAHRKFSELVAPLDADPVRRVRNQEASRALRLVVDLGRFLDDACETEEGPLPDPEVPPCELAIDVDDSVYLATLKEGIEALGGRLEVTAVFPDERVQLMG